MNGIKTLDTIETAIETIDGCVKAIARIPKDMMTYFAFQKIAKEHRRIKKMEEREKRIAIKIAVRSYMITSMNDFNNENKSSHMTMDKFGRFTRVR
jgi:hypothetical protein